MRKKNNPKDNLDPMLVRRTIDSKEKAVIWNDALICVFENLKNWISIGPRLSNHIISDLAMDIDEFELEKASSIISKKHSR